MSQYRSPKVESTIIKPLEFLRYSGKKAVPLVLQSEVAECGLACLAMISSYYGNKVNVALLRKGQVVGSQGMNLRQVMETAGTLELSARAIQCDLQEINKLSLPCMVHWDLDHFVVLTGVSRNTFYINDPALGKRKVTAAEFNDSFTGIALELTPSTLFKKQDSRVVMKISQLWDKITGLKRSLISLLLLSIVMQFSALLSPYYMQIVVDNVLMSHDQSLLVVLAVGFTLLAVAQTLISALRSWLVIRLSSALNIQMGGNLFHHLIRLPMSYFEKRFIGDIMSRFNAMNAIKDLLTTGIVESIIDGVMALALLVMMFLYSPQLAGVVLLAVFLSFALQSAFYYPNRRATEAAIVAEAKEDSAFLETLRAMQTIKLFSHETSRQNIWLNRYSEVVNNDIRLGKLEIAEQSLNRLIFALETIVVVYIGALIVIEGDLTVGMLLAFIAYKTQFSTSTSALIDNIFSFKLMSLHLERLSDITLEKREPAISKLTLPRDIRGHIKVENVSFRYADNLNWIIRDLSFEVKPGECVALSGPSGCGKTTLMKLLLGLLNPVEGDIYIDGFNIKELALSDYRKHLGSVMQEDTLLSGTLSENITMFDVNFDEHRLRHCCEQANILDDIQGLPMEFNSLVGDMGSQFSGGQLQRILLARALYKRPQILCLDESTSHLDSDSEHVINQNVSELSMTRVIIAHRKETIESADRVLLLRKII
ncbi:peptidase domain-containing ABC transporter [Vibrio aestuarianus]|uniref:peptidase domain-containing ABC transporter n=1 Tax=Vibrio aestuarianus TaxID=28171 RepID=UPI00237CEE29|nr:peptidase domain-containing ABC transporter [Vibrio aestuarianus]MDE1348793.1 peptidase domain-containing ABC transporter [Vibrio aestuarianus]